MTRVVQADFRAALLDPALPAPEALGDGRGGPAGRRFDVYRNNVAASLTEAVLEGFPTVARLIGETNLRRIALPFLRAHPPRDPRMFRYGDAFPDFLAGFPPLAQMGYLPDAARLDLALRSSYHAADATPVAPDRLAALPQEVLPLARLRFAPALRLLPSAWPLHDIWRKAHEAEAPAPRPQAQDVLISRPGYDPRPDPLSKPQGLMMRALLDGANVSEAHAACEGDEAPLTDLLGLLLARGAITDLEVPG